MLNKGSKRERGSLSSIILAALLCNLKDLKMLFRISLDADVQMLAP